MIIIQKNDIPRSAIKAIKKISGSRGPGIPDLSIVSDPRSSRGRRFPLSLLLETLFLGMLGSMRSLENLEAFCLCRGLKISDSTFYVLLRKLKADSFSNILYKQVKKLYRAKALDPMGLRCHVIAIDNKTLYFGPDKVSELCQTVRDPHSKAKRFHFRSIGAMLTSNLLMPILDRMAIPPETNDMGIFPEFFKRLRKQYGKSLLERSILTLDSGFCSLENANLIDKSGCIYIFSLKANQSSLYNELKRIFKDFDRKEPEVTTGWMPYKGKEIRYKFYRTTEISGWVTDGGDWSHLRQGFLVITEERRQVSKKKKGRRSKRLRPIWSEPKVVYIRYFISNMLVNYLTSDEILTVIRSHWGIENNGHWVFNTIWKEKEAPWCRQNESLMILAILRALAADVLRWLKHRRLRSEAIRNMRWRQLLDFIKEVMGLSIKFPSPSPHITMVYRL